MNEFVSKKLGEVLAFTNVGQQLVEKGGEALIEALGDETVNNYSSNLITQQEKLKSLANEITHQKAAATGQKLMGMAETYIGDQWNNPTELLEWLGFFEGAAIVHWHVIAGASRHTAELGALSQSGIELHDEILRRVRDGLEQIGAQRAQ